MGRKPTTISHVITMGDSLSDTGTMNRRYLLGFIPMREISGLQGQSPQGCFTNGLVWTDHLSAIIANQFAIVEQEAGGLCPIDIADEIIANDPNLKTLIQNGYFFNNDLFIKYRGRDLVRNYDEGGLTAHDYSWQPSKSLTRFFSRLILSTLASKRDKLLAYDRAHALSNAHKAQTLVIEWSGANDLITVNEKPSTVEADKAVKDRIDNVERLIENGYRHFVLFNLPDLSLTPRYQAKSEAEILNAKTCVEYFNIQLGKASQTLNEAYPHCSVEVFDAKSLFEAIYTHPEHHGFEKAKLKIPYTQSPDFELEKNGLSPAKGYMFWDDVHPCSNVHALLAERFYLQYSLKYTFAVPDIDTLKEPVHNISEAALRASFVAQYSKQLERDRHGFWGRFSSAPINYKTIGLVAILKYALIDNDQRTRAVITQLQWIDNQGNLNLNIPLLKEAMAALKWNQEKEDSQAVHKPG